MFKVFLLSDFHSCLFVSIGDATYKTGLIALGLLLTNSGRNMWEELGAGVLGALNDDSWTWSSSSKRGIGILGTAMQVWKLCMLFSGIGSNIQHGRG